MSNDKNNLVYREQLDDNVIEMLSEDIGSNYSLRTENTKTIVAALNEILGKDIICNAVGSPLLTTDTFAQMGEKIHVMVNDFKAKLLGLGVSVSNVDKMAALIEKIGEIDLGVDAEELLTPLEESLREILVDEGVELSGEETLAELIVKVDELLDGKNNIINNLSNLISIKIVDELPSIGETDTLYLLQNDIGDCDDVIIGTPAAYDTNINEFNNKIVLEVDGNTMDERVSLKLNIVDSNVYAHRVFIIQNGEMIKINGYCYKNNKWETLGRFYLYNNGYIREDLADFVQGTYRTNTTTPGVYSIAKYSSYLQVNFEPKMLGSMHQYNEGKFLNNLYLPSGHGFKKICAEVNICMSTTSSSVEPGESVGGMIYFGSAVINGWETGVNGSGKTAVETDITNVSGNIEIRLRCSMSNSAGEYPSNTVKGYLKLYTLYIE